MASTQAQLRSINCTQCGAPLTLHGGHRVQTITCGFCATELDAFDEYKVIRRFINRDRPPSPFEIGMVGTVKGVEFTVIGLVQMRTTDGYAWLEFQLYSPTHGYAWLEQVDNHFLFSRRTRDMPTGVVSTLAKSTFKVRDTTFKVFEAYTAEIIYVEGELTFIAKTSDQSRIVEAIAPPKIYSIESTEGEEEYVIGEYLDADELFESFGLGEPPTIYTVHPAQPYQPSGFTSGMGLAGKVFGPVALFLLIGVLLFGSGTTLIKREFGANDVQRSVETQSFAVTDPGKLLELDMYSPQSNSWAAYDIVVRKDGKSIFSMAKEISYYSGYDGGESWSEGSRDAHAYFKVPEAGNYTLGIEGQTDRRVKPKGLRLELREGVIVSRYFWILLLLSAFAFLTPLIAKLKFESKRWADTAEDDDD